EDGTKSRDKSLHSLPRARLARFANTRSIISSRPLGNRTLRQPSPPIPQSVVDGPNSRLKPVSPEDVPLSLRPAQKQRNPEVHDHQPFSALPGWPSIQAIEAQRSDSEMSLVFLGGRLNERAPVAKLRIATRVTNLSFALALAARSLCPRSTALRLLGPKTGPGFRREPKPAVEPPTCAQTPMSFPIPTQAPKTPLRWELCPG